MKAWFNTLTQREQLSLLVLAGALALYCLWMLLLAPLDRARDDLARQNVAIGQSLHRVDEMVSQILVLRDSGTGPQRRNLTSVINRSTAALNLQVARLQPNSRGEVQVRLEGAVFDDLVAWLHQMEYRDRLLVREVSIAPGSAPGFANATVRLAQAE